MNNEFNNGYDPDQNRLQQEQLKAQEKENLDKAGEVVVKGAATALGGPAATEAINTIEKIPGGKKKLQKSYSKAGKRLGKNPVLRNVVNKLGESGKTDQLNQGLSMAGGSKTGGMPNTSKNSLTSGNQQSQKNSIDNNGLSKKKTTKATSNEGFGGSGEIKKKLPIILILSTLAVPFLVVAVVVLVVVNVFSSVSSLFSLDVYLGNADSDFAVSIGSMFSGCDDEDSDICKSQTKLFEEIKKVSDSYMAKGIEINTSLIMQSLTMSSNFNLNIEDPEGTDGETLTEEELADRYEDARKYVDDLAENMIEGNQIDLEKFETYLKDEFIKEYYLEDYKEDDIDQKVDLIIRELFLRFNFYEAGTKEEEEDISSAIICKSLILNEEETISVEDYVARVLTSKTDGEYNIEALKATAVVIRTKVIFETDNCLVALTEEQISEMEDEAFSLATKAAEETKGEVLMQNDEVLPVEYDLFCFNSTACESGENDDGSLYSTYKKIPTMEEHVISLTNSVLISKVESGGKGLGLSTLVANEMAIDGSSYNEILEFFFSADVSVTAVRIGELSFPVLVDENVITSPYGWRLDPFGSGSSVFHRGTDFAGYGYPSPAGGPVFAVDDGVVLWNHNVNDRYSGLGNYVILGHGLKEDGTYEYYTLYAHFQSHSSFLNIGDKVESGDRIGSIGTTGSSTGNHLHFEVIISIPDWNLNLRVHVPPETVLGDEFMAAFY